jgi:hypothetical protein
MFTLILASDISLLLRVVEDYGVIYLGSAVFKIARLLFVAMVSVHLFACIFFRVKVVSAAAEEDVAAFYTSKNVSEDVSISCQWMKRLLVLILISWSLAWHVPCPGSWTTIREFFPFANDQYSKFQYVQVFLFLKRCSSCSWFASIIYSQRSQLLATVIFLPFDSIVVPM